MNIKIKKLTPADVEDYITYFETTPHDDCNPINTCYCVSWCSDDHGTMDVYPSCEERRRMDGEYVKSGKIQGYLALVDGRIVGWCNANTKSECQNCGGWLYSMPQIRKLQFDQEEKVKSVFCFLVEPSMKRKGIARKLLEYACQDAANSGFHYVEAYPSKEITNERTFFTGFVNMYKDLGFNIYAETEEKMIMRKQLNEKISI